MLIFSTLGSNSKLANYYIREKEGYSTLKHIAQLNAAQIIIGLTP